MTLQRRDAGVHLLLPADLAGLRVDIEDHPAVLVRRDRADFLRVEDACLHWSVSAGHHARDEDMVAPDDRRTPAAARDRRLPCHVLGRAPFFGQPRVVGDDTTAEAAELRPTGLGGREPRGERDQTDNAERFSHGEIVLLGYERYTHAGR